MKEGQFSYENGYPWMGGDSVSLAGVVGLPFCYLFLSHMVKPIPDAGDHCLEVLFSKVRRKLKSTSVLKSSTILSTSSSFVMESLFRSISLVDFWFNLLPRL